MPNKCLIRIAYIISFMLLITHSNTAFSGEKSTPVVRTIEATAGGTSNDITVYEGNLAVVYYKAATASGFKLWLDDGTSGTAGDGIAQAGEIRVIETTANVGEFCSIAVVDGHLAVAYLDAANEDVKLWVDADGDETVDVGETSVIEALAVDGSGKGIDMVTLNDQLAVVYSDWDNDKVKVWIDNGSGSGTAKDEVAHADEIQTIVNDTNNTATQFGITTINNQLAVSFYNLGVTELQLWWDDGNGGGTAADGLVHADEIRVVDTTGDQGIYSSITTVNNGNSDYLAISYYDTTNDELEIWLDLDSDGVNDGGTERITPDATSGDESAIITRHDRLFVAYWDDAGDDLHMWSDNGKAGGVSGDKLVTAGELEILDGSVAITGHYPSLTHYDGGLAISYYDQTTTQPKIMVIPDPIDDQERTSVWDATSGLFNASAVSASTATGTSLDQGTAFSASANSSAVDSQGIVYTAFIQSNGAENHAYLSRFTGKQAEIWDHSATAWTTTMANGEPIDTAVAGRITTEVKVHIDSNDDVFVAMIHEDTNSSVGHLHVTRYDSSAGTLGIHDNAGPSWNATLSSGDVIDDSTTSQASTTPVMVSDGTNVYFSYVQSDGAANHIFISRVVSSTAAATVLDSSGPSWSATLTAATPIDVGTSNQVSKSPSMAIDTAGTNIYVAYSQQIAAGVNSHIHVTRVITASATPGIADNAGPSWNATLVGGFLTSGDAIDFDTAGYEADLPKIVLDATYAYIFYVQSDGTANHLRSSRITLTDATVNVHDTAGWNATRSTSDVMDNTTAAQATTALDVVVDDTDTNAYIAYTQSDGTADHVYVARLALAAGTSTVYDNAGPSFSATLNDGDPIDLAVSAQAASSPNIGLDLHDQLYVSYLQSNGTENHVYLSRLADIATPSTFGIWDANTTAFTTTLGNGDPIDIGGALAAASPNLAMGRANRAYVSYVQTNGSENHLYLSRLGEYAGSVGTASFTPVSLVSSATGSVNVTFDATKGIEAYGKVELTFPTGYDLTGVTSTSVTSNSTTVLDGTLTAAVSGQVITVTRSGTTNPVQLATTVSLTVANIKNPSAAGATGLYTIKTKTNRDVIIDTNSSVTASTIVDGPVTLGSSGSSGGGCLITDSFDLTLLIIMISSLLVFLIGSVKFRRQ